MHISRQDSGVFKIPITCFSFPGMNPNQNRYLSHISLNEKGVLVIAVNLATEVEYP